MNNQNLTDVRNRLEKELARLQNNEVLSVANTDGRVDVLESRADNADEEADAAKVERDLALERHTLESIQQIESALQRLAGGQYGVCIDCGDTIPSARLQAFPAAARCIACKQIYELSQA